MELSWNEIEAMWKRHGGYIRGRNDDKFEIAGADLRDFIEELIDVSLGDKGPDGIEADDVAALYARLQELEQGAWVRDVIESAAMAVEKALRVRFNRPDATFILGTWDCSESPTEQCIFDLGDDDGEETGDERCMFCHQPNERK
jgi:hypothetical protein